MEEPKDNVRYRATTDVHRNIRTNVTTADGNVIHLYTDSFGVLREMREGEGHPFLSPEVGVIFASMPTTAGWNVSEIDENEEEPPVEYIPIQYQPEATMATPGGQGTLALRVRELLEMVAAQESVISTLRRREAELEEQIAQLTRQPEQLPEGLGQDERPAAPMVENGRVVPAKAPGRGRGRPVAANGDDNVDREALGDIPGAIDGTDKSDTRKK